MIDRPTTTYRPTTVLIAAWADHDVTEQVGQLLEALGASWKGVQMTERADMDATVLALLASHADASDVDTARTAALVLTDRLGKLLAMLESQGMTGAGIEAARDASYHLADVRTCLRDAG